MDIKTPKKLIEVALPLDDINVAAVHEKSIRHGHPSTLHLWWARRPLAAARAVLFAQLVNDPGYERNLQRGMNKKEAEKERERLFKIINDLVRWENSNNEEVLRIAREEIWKSWRETCELNKKHAQVAELFDPEKLPAFHDPFAGGGALPLEAQRLGLEAYASDLNPVAVLINKAMIEIPPKFAGRPPIGPVPKDQKQTEMHEDWRGARGLAEDVRRYGNWMRDEAQKRIGRLYPRIKITEEMVDGQPELKSYIGKTLTVVAWLWARTVKSPNPAFANIDVPLASTFMLSTKKNREIYVEPIVERGTYRFTVRMGKPRNSEIPKIGTSAGKRAGFRCLMSGVPIPYEYIREEGKAGRMGARLLAMVAEGDRGRIYLPPTDEMETIAHQVEPTWRPDCEMPRKHRNFQPPGYGLTNLGDLFTSRQLVALTTFSDLVLEVRTQIERDAISAGLMGEDSRLSDGGRGAAAYADAVAVYLSFAISKLADRGSSICTWFTERDSTRNTFSRQAIPMTWDFAELNTLLDGTGSFIGAINWTAESIEGVAAGYGSSFGVSEQSDAATQCLSLNKVISTDPPYYDNIGYADLSDFFYVWLRRSLRTILPDLFATLAVPKTEELVAMTHRHGTKEKAEVFFVDGMTQAMHRLAEQAHPAFPVTIYYAFKQSETKDTGTSSTGWETFIDAVLRAGFSIGGTWPMRTELSNRMIGSGTNALASSIILVCRKREIAASQISRREFLRELKEELPGALEAMIGGESGIAPVAPVDLAQAAIGPGMAIYSRHSSVLKQDGTPMSVHEALVLINEIVDEVLDPDKQGSSADSDTRFCVKWFEQFGWSASAFGEADVLARAKGTSVDGVVHAGVVESGSSKVRLLKWTEYPVDWNPKSDDRVPIWQATHHLIRALQQSGESDAGVLLARMPEKSEGIRQLAYKLYTLCERKGWAEDARAYNELITAWASIESASHETGPLGEQETLGL